MIKEIESHRLNDIIDNITLSIEDSLSDSVFYNPSYEKGLLGFSLYYSYLARYKNEQFYISKAEECFEKGIKSLNIMEPIKRHIARSIDFHFSQIGRFVGFAVKHQLLDISASEYLDRLDENLFILMKGKLSIGDVDSGSGALASGYYFLSRANSGISVTEQLSYLVKGINTVALKDIDGGLYWESKPFYNRIYLGISHGSSLIISFLSSVYEHNIEPELCRNVIEKAMNFLIKQYRKSDHKGLFPNMIGDKVAPMQFSLCYGDIGMGYALLKAEKLLQSEQAKLFADLVLNDCLTRSMEDRLTLDASIYYGASGLGIAFDKLAAITSDSRFSNRARYWYEQIPNYKTDIDDYTGFQTRLNREEDSWNLFNVSFGWGITGIGISAMQFLDKSLPPLAELTFVA